MANKTNFVGVRMTEEQRVAFEIAAGAAGKSVSTWLRSLGVAASTPPPSTASDVRAFERKQARK